MKRLRYALTPFILLMAGMPSVLTATRLSLPSIPDFRLPSAGVVNTVFPAATGGAAPYTYSVSGLPPGISFTGSSRRASGTLPTVSTETTYTVTYSVRDGAGASASVSFRATVAPPPAPPPPPPSSLSLPTVPDFRLPSGGSVDTVFPAATGGRRPYSYSVSGLPPGISFSHSTRRARGTLPTVVLDTTYTVTYSVRDSRSATDSVTFTAVVVAPAVPPPPPPLSLPAIPDSRLPSGGSMNTTLPAATGGVPPYRYSVSGLPPGITFDASTRSLSGTLPTVTADTTYRVVYTARDSSGTIVYGSVGTTVRFSTTVTASTAPQPDPPSSDPPPSDPTPSPPTADGGPIVKTGVNVSSSRTYPFTLSHRAVVSVELTGMTTDFDCTVSGNRCTNRGSTRDDSWTGTLEAGEHKIVVYPYGGGSGNYTLTISAGAPTTGGSTGTRTQVTTLVDTSETNISTSRTYSFTLARRAEVDVALTGLTIDFDCRVGSSRCTNRWGTRDDSWSGDLDQGSHSVVVYPYDPGPGNYSLTVTATETITFVATPLAGGPIRLRVCEEDKRNTDTDAVVPGSCVEVVIPGGEGDPDDGGDDDGDDGGGGGPATPQEPTDEQKDQMESDAREDAAARAQRYNCKLFFRQNGELDIVGALGSVSFDRTDPVNACTDEGDAAYSDYEEEPGMIFTCDLFYDGSDSLRADTVLHEMLHLAGKSHDDLGGPGPFHQKVMNACP